MTPAQRYYIDKLRAELGWTGDQVHAYATACGIVQWDATPGAASRLIRALQRLVGGEATR